MLLVINFLFLIVDFFSNPREYEHFFNTKLCFIVSIIIFILYLFIKFNYNRYFQKIFKISTNPEDSRLAFILKDAKIISLIVAGLVISLAIFEIINYSNFLKMLSYPNIVIEFLIIFICFILFITLKVLIILIISYAFDLQKECGLHILQILNSIEIFSLIIYPLCLLLPFISKQTNDLSVNIFFIIIAFIFIIIFILKFVLFYTKIIEKKFFNYRFFLYFCGVEILPYIVIYYLIT